MPAFLNPPSPSPVCDCFVLPPCVSIFALMFTRSYVVLSSIISTRSNSWLCAYKGDICGVRSDHWKRKLVTFKFFSHFGSLYHRLTFPERFHPVLSLCMQGHVLFQVLIDHTRLIAVGSANTSEAIGLPNVINRNTSWLPSNVSLNTRGFTAGELSRSIYL